MEVRGDADAPEWVYQKGLASGDWTTGDLVTPTAVRHIHALAMSKVWDVAPDRAQRDERGQWRSTRNWVTHYRRSRYQRGA